MISLTALAGLWSAAAIALEVAGRREPSPDARYDAIVVLGCGVMPGGRAGPSLARRARRGAELAREGRAPVIVLTGGVGHSAPSEARAASEVVRAAGFGSAEIVLEERSTSTRENARLARVVIPEARRIVVVTDGYHAIRARRIFLRHFEEVDVAPVRGGRWTRAKGALREVLAVAGDAVRPSSRLDHRRPGAPSR
jgi:uncharacterized SAM-binding protein YcdF (DUF218 family)